MNILVAGVGNVFLGDDAFGCAVAQELAGLHWPAGVRVRDFGIRGVHLAYELEGGVDAAILVDSVQRQGKAGTLYVIEADRHGSEAHVEAQEISAHAMEPNRVLAWLAANGRSCKNMIVVGCEPESFGTEDDGAGRMGLSASVAAAIPDAVKLVQDIVDRLVQQEGASHA